ncbi:hypothetical protein J8F10_21505 [Gemmata sp. G18]|uniref:Uncharacterized protein n=1 Tax=Gemmata palustris TaxID=2822762 RepID=A0ABS5BY79_9BACT|nr:hypothetical protein [Gemmata palustris]MBP3957838.1 hypothetical protein [Gemmata palustris]
MAKTVTIDELHLTVSIPHDLPDARREEIRQTLASDDFMDRLRATVRAATQAFPELAAARVSLSR